MELSDIGLIGLGVMGANLALNMEEKGFQVSVYNRPHKDSNSVVDTFISENKNKNFFGTEDLEKFVASIAEPRKIILMVKAGEAVDELISKLTPYLSKGDIIIDGGNSDFHDSARRQETLENNGFLFVGSGISGGEEGARHGPSIMPSGSPEAWPKIRQIFQTISAKADDGSACCRWIGSGGSGHFVKMVHNAIEYGDMQLIAEAYNVLKECNGLDNDEISKIFYEWNKGDLDSYLIEITSKILAIRDADGVHIVDKILDAASQKGTGKWAVESSLDEGEPFGLISESVFARFMSVKVSARNEASKLFPPTAPSYGAVATQDIRAALLISKIISYAQGFSLMRSASEKYGWNLDFSGIAKIWRAGCIIRSSFLDKISEAYAKNPKLENLIFDKYFGDIIRNGDFQLRKIVGTAVMNGISMVCMSSAVQYFDALRSKKSSANLIQAQRDFFGAHTYEMVDEPRGKFFHTDWAAECKKLDDKTSIEKI